MNSQEMIKKTFEELEKFFTDLTTRYPSLKDNLSFLDMKTVVYTNCVVAGGFYRCLNQNKEWNDIDVFFKSHYALGRFLTQLAGACLVEKNLIKEFKYTDKALTFNKLKVSFITSNVQNSVDRLLDTFDFNFNHWGFDVSTGEFVKPLNIPMQLLNYFSAEPTYLVSRMVRFTREGFNFSDKEWSRALSLVTQMNTDKRLDPNINNGMAEQSFNIERGSSSGVVQGSVSPDEQEFIRAVNVSQLAQYQRSAMQDMAQQAYRELSAAGVQLGTAETTVGSGSYTGSWGGMVQAAAARINRSEYPTYSIVDDNS